MNNMKPKDYLKQPYASVLIPQDAGRYYAKIQEFPGCQAVGKTREEALHNLQVAAEEWIESEIEQGHDIPPPEANQQYSGTFLIRTSPALHQECAQNAERQGISLNHYAIQKLSAGSREDTLVHVLTENVRRMQSIYIAQLTSNLQDAHSREVVTALFDQWSMATATPRA
jgi:predicted RNase H-like HicB family nuclease